MKLMNTLDLTKKLVSIPSYVGEDCDERKAGEFIFNYLSQFKFLTVIKQEVKDGRFNVIAFDNYPTETIFCGHFDTVQPRSEWKTNPFTPTLVGKKLYGLGIADMKSSIAAMLSALSYVKETRGIMFFFYIDEEYDFLGMKKFIKEYARKLKPKLIVSGDGGNLQMGNGCRGLIELNITVKGETGHASRPQSGNNAIVGSSTIVNKLIKTFKSDFKSKELGKTTCNLAYLQGGLDIGKDPWDKQIFGKEGNNIADIAEFILDIRTADPKLNAQKVLALITKYAKELNLRVVSTSVRHDYGAWITNKKELKEVSKVTGTGFIDIGSLGFMDVQLLWQTFNNVPSFIIGAGDLGVAHKPNEYVSLPKLEKLSKVVVELLHLYGRGGEK
jgi:succinyl-diaminopimelate desuccinylase